MVMWVTTVPSSGLAGNVFFDGVAVQSPSPTGFPGGIQPVTWQGTFFSMTPGAQRSMAMGGCGVRQLGFWHGLYPARRQTRGRQQGERLSELGPRRYAGKFQDIRGRRRDRRRRREFHRFLKRYRRVHSHAGQHDGRRRRRQRLRAATAPRTDGIPRREAASAAAIIAGHASTSSPNLRISSCASRRAASESRPSSRSRGTR